MQSYYFHLAFELYSGSNKTDPSAPPCFIPPANLDLLTAELPSSQISSSKIGPIGSLTSQKDIESDKVRTGHLITARSACADPRSRCPDWRLASISIDSVNMETRDDADVVLDAHSTSNNNDALAIRAKYVPSQAKTTDIGWGVVHLYRDTATYELGEDGRPAPKAESGYAAQLDEEEAFVDKDCTTLCILAVPSYMTPSDFLGWVGEGAGQDISHFKLVKTGRSNKYMALMKFRDPKKARQWHKEWNGKPFSSMEPENCHVVFIKTIQFHTTDITKDPSSFPNISNDPFKPSFKTNHINASDSSRTSSSLTAKPRAPPPSLVELPTCPVCLERMDETTGLLTIFCQHVFHCACLQKWRGSGCPVCRYTQDPVAGSKKSDLEGQDNECKSCGSQSNLWICLICGHVGCGRYDEAHAFAHFEESGHSFAMDIATQHVWDYTGDGYVHRLLQNKSDGKLFELPSRRTGSVNGPGDELLSRDKIENIGLEYTYLLTGQLNSQRLYFEEQLERAVEKASKATATAEKSFKSSEGIEQQLAILRAEHDTLLHDTIPQLDRDRERLERRAQKFEATAREMTKKWQEDKAISESLMDRVNHLEKQLNDSTLKCSELEEQNRDLSFFISGMEKLKDQSEDIVQGTVTVADAPQADKKKKGKKK